MVVDAVEGVMLNTERLLRHAVTEGLAITVVINKVDRLILELKLPPTDAYHKMVHTLEEINDILEKMDYFAPPPAAAATSAAAAAAASSSSAAASARPQRQRLSPAHNNVCFASALHGWVFSCSSFAKIYADYHQNFPAEELAKRLWGNLYLHSDRKFRAKPQNSENARTFIHFILEPLYKIYSYVLGHEGAELAQILSEQLGLTLKKHQLEMDSKPLLRTVCQAFFGGVEALVGMVKQHVPTPVEAAARKVRHLYTGPLVGPLAESLLSCDAAGPLLLHTAKNYARTDGSAFDNFGRVFSGTVRVGDSVRVLGEGYSADDEEDSSVRTISRIWIMQGRYRVEVNRVRAGNLALFEGMDGSITKTATITSVEASAAAGAVAIFRPLQFNTVSVFKVAIEPINPSELPRMLEGLRKIDRSYPLAQTRVEESGEHVVLGTGEIYMDCILHDLRKLFGFSSGGAAAVGIQGTGSTASATGEIEIKISDPQVRFCETVLEGSSIKCEAETPNKRNTLGMIAEPLEAGIAEDIESGRVRITGTDLNPRSEEAKARAQFFQDKYNWDVLSARSIWSFGPEAQGPNLLVDHTLPAECDRKKLWSVRDSIMQGFQWGTREGPLWSVRARGGNARRGDS